MISERDCIAMAADCGLGNIPTDALVRLCNLAAQAEREACAQVCDGIAASKECQTGDLPEPAEECAAAIRARGQA
jgi:hypothetical protein